MSSGLRERKKQKTRAAIAEAALELFADKGFEETTVAEIAEAAEVSPRTFFTYFPAKEDVVFAVTKDEALTAMRSRIAERGPEESTVDALRAWMLARVADPDFNDADEVRLRKLIRETPALAAYELAHVDTEFQEILAEGVAADLGVAADELAPRMVAAAASAALRALVDFYADSDDSHEPEQLLEQASRFLEAGLASLSTATR